MHNAGVSRTDSHYLLAESWLAAQQNDARRGRRLVQQRDRRPSDALDTAMAYQALMSARRTTRTGIPTSPRPSCSRLSGPTAASLHRHRSTDAEATSAGIQAILAMGEHPDDADWTTASGDTPITRAPAPAADQRLYKSTSSSRHARRHRHRLDPGRPQPEALRERRQSDFPENPGSAHKAFKFRPQLNSISPKNGAKFTHTTRRRHPRDVHRLLSQGHRHQPQDDPALRGRHQQVRSRRSSASTGCT